MCSRRFLPTVGLSVALCCFVVAGYYSYLKATADGGYTEWSVWSNCTKQCGEGIQTRYRRCEQPSPGKYGKDCYRLGSNHDQKPCFLKICPIDGKFGEWSGFSACDKPCGGGKQVRTRQCNNPPAVFGGKPCEGTAKEEQDCNTQICPVDGGYTEWSEYSPCSVTCGKGTMTRTRSCTNPPPSNGGKECAEPASETTECDKGVCVQPTVQPEPKNETKRNDSSLMPDQQAAGAQNPDQQVQVAQNPGEQAAQKPEEQKQ